MFLHSSDVASVEIIEAKNQDDDVVERTVLSYSELQIGSGGHFLRNVMRFWLSSL